MDSDDVIIIEDTPPSTPIKQKPITSKKTPQENMYYQTQNHEFPVAEQAMIWSRNTSNFIKQSMTSAVQQNNRMATLHNQNKPISYMDHLSAMQQSYQYNGGKNFPRPPYTIYNHPFNTQFYQLNGFSSLENLNNFWMKVKLEELPDKGEIVSQYYIDETQTPVRINNNENETIMPEFIDINALSFKNNTYPSLETSDSMNLATEIDEKKRKNPVPLFLKRNRTICNNKMKETESNATTVKDDTDDIIFIGEFKRTDKIGPLEKEINNSIPVVRSIPDKQQPQHSEIEQKSFKFGKKKRKERTLIPLRRNPKRQVQIEKDFLKMIDDVITVSEKEERQKKNMNFKQTTKPVKSTIKPSCRRSPRNLSLSGAVYNPPSPLTTAHIRDWPTEGMHERPEYDPVAGKLLPFDNLILNISKQYLKQNKQQDPPDQATKYEIPAQVETTEDPKLFPDLCHEMLHHVLAFIASVKIMEKETGNTVEERDKLNFLELLDLQQNDEKEENKICDILHSVVNDITSKDVNKIWQNENEFTLTELLKNNIIIYCLTNNVEKSDVAKYIASVKPEDIIKLSNEQFKILSNDN